jgi:hypothetical protein
MSQNLTVQAAADDVTEVVRVEVQVKHRVGIS